MCSAMREPSLVVAMRVVPDPDKSRLRKFMAGEPTNAATNREAGRA